MERKKFVVKRSEWLRGGRNGKGVAASSTLRDDDGHMCCLGFAGQQLCDINPIRLRNVATPGGTYAEDERAFIRGMPGLFSGETMSRIMRTNDNDLDIPESVHGRPQAEVDAWREAKLKELFNEIEIDVEFID